MGVFSSMLGRNSDHSHETSTLKTTPWAWRDVEGAYVGWNGEAWLYRELPVYPLTWEDPSTRLERGSALHQLLLDMSNTGREVAGLATLSKKRNIHMVSVSWDDLPKIPDTDITPGQQAYLTQTLTFKTPQRALLVGVQLFSSALGAIAKKKGKGGSWWEALRQVTDDALGEGVPNMASFEEDRRYMEETFRRVGAKVPSADALRQLESWYNDGKGPDCEILERRDALYLRGSGEQKVIELAAVMSFDRTHLKAPDDQWILEAFSHENPATVVSVRAELDPARNARERIRRNKRRLLAQQSEVNVTGDLARVEDEMTFDLTQTAEDFFATSGEPLVSATSIVLARASTGFADDTYIDYLRTIFDIEMKTLEHRQLAALEETLPCARARVNPFLQEVSVGMLSYSGMHAHSRLGDKDGTVYLGLCDPDGTPVMINPLGAPKADLPPAMFLFGDPGSGKASSVDAQVLTPRGWTRMGDISVGDTITDSHGGVQTVLAVFPQGDQQLFRVTLSDGGSTEVTGDHWWTVQFEGESQWRLLTTAEVSRALDAGRHLRLPVMSAAHYSTGPSIEDRHEQLLTLVAKHHGRVDSDGTTRIDAELPLVGTSAADVAAFVDLVRSLGGVATVGDTTATGVIPYGEDSPLILLRTVVDITPTRVAPAQCIKVSAPDSLYVTDDYICTHNTFALQSIATQAALLNKQTIFLNPKGFDTLSPFAEAVGGSVVKMSALEGEGGFFDPFRYAPTPQMAAEIATEYILSVVGPGLTQNQRAQLGATIKRAAANGAQCVGQALSKVHDEQVKSLILDTMNSSATFQLGIGLRPMEPIGLTGGLTLIEFDRKLDLPEKGVDPASFRDSQRISLAAIRLVSRASLEMLNRSGGGVFILDEAWTVLGSSEGLAILQQLGREGRSLNILPILATQRVADLLREGVDMQSYMTRVLAMKLDDPVEAAAALTLCGLEPTPQRVQWLHSCGPKRFEDGTTRPAYGIHRDLEKRHAALMVGPVPPAYYTAFTTNPEEKKRRDQTTE